MREQTRAALEAATESTLMFFGDRAQMIKTCEELGELTTVLCKHLNANWNTVTKEKIVDEIADVIIMVNQMRFVFGGDDVDLRVLYKLNRTMDYVRSREKSDDMRGAENAAKDE